MSKPRQNKALAVLDGRLHEARRQHELAFARVNETDALLKELMSAREQVAKAYERKGAGKPVKSSTHARAAKLLDDAAVKAIRERNAETTAQAERAQAVARLRQVEAQGQGNAAQSQQP